MLKDPPFQNLEDSGKLPDGVKTSENAAKTDPDSSSSGSDQEGQEEDEELEKLMRENSDLESSSSSGDNDDERKGIAGLKENPRKRRNHDLHRYESPSNNIAILMLACWTLRVPVLYRDINL